MTDSTMSTVFRSPALRANSEPKIKILELAPTSLQGNALIDADCMHIHGQRQYDHEEDLLPLVRPYSSTQACHCQ